MAPQRWTYGERLDGIFWHLCEHDLPNTRWMIVRADDPSAVSWYMEAKISPSFNPNAQEKKFSITKIDGFATWQEVEDKLKTL
jgi:hypothetical protein